jgi:hypothetical protein
MPVLRLDLLGKYLRQKGGIDSIATRGSFRTGDDHFLLDYSIGRWFQHESFAFGYVVLIGAYFLGWFMISIVLFLFSIPLLLTILIILRRLASGFLSPYNPKEVASRIELIYPPKPLKRILGQILLRRTEKRDPSKA